MPEPQNSDERPRYLVDDLPHLVPQGRLLRFDFCTADLQIRGSYGHGMEMMALELLRQLGEARSDVVGLAVLEFDLDCRTTLTGTVEATDHIHGLWFGRNSG